MLNQKRYRTTPTHACIKSTTVAHGTQERLNSTIVSDPRFNGNEDCDDVVHLVWGVKTRLATGKVRDDTGKLGPQGKVVVALVGVVEGVGDLDFQRQKLLRELVQSTTQTSPCCCAIGCRMTGRTNSFCRVYARPR